MGTYLVPSKNGKPLFSYKCESFKECIEKAVKDGVNLSGAYLIATHLIDADLTNANLSYANLSYANLSYTKLRGANLTDANLTNANLTKINLSKASLTNADLTGANFTNAILYGANLRGANLTNADLTGANFTNADLRGANLTNAKLTGANFTNADLTGANLTDAKLTGANLTNADLTSANLTITPVTVTLVIDELLTKKLIDDFDIAHTRYETLQNEISQQSYNVGRHLLHTVGERVNLSGCDLENLHTFDFIFEWYDEYTGQLEQHSIKTIYKDSNNMLYIEDENGSEYELSELNTEMQIKVIVRLVARKK